MTLTEQVQEHLDDCIYPVLARVEVFCMIIGMSESALRRKLRQEGTSWTELYNAEIQKRLLSMIQQGIPQQEMAKDLGYSHAQNLGRFQRLHRQ